MATVLLRRIGIRRIIAKAAHDLHGSILEQVGATRVVYPEAETGFRVAHSFLRARGARLPRRWPGYGVAKVAIVGGLVGKTIGEIDLTTTCRLSVLAVARPDSVVAERLTR